MHVRKNPLAYLAHLQIVIPHAWHFLLLQNAQLHKLAWYIGFGVRFDAANLNLVFYCKRCFFDSLFSDLSFLLLFIFTSLYTSRLCATLSR